MFGAEEFYFTELQNFKKSLLSLYQKRVKYSAERENERWKYVTQTKGEWSTLTAKLYDQAFLEGSGVVDLLRAVLVRLAKMFPMVKLDGDHDPAFGRFEHFGGPLQLSLLSPTAHLITDPFYKGEEVNLKSDSRPFYKMYGNSIRGTTALVDDYFFGNIARATTAAWDAELGQWVHLTWPVTDEWVEAMVRSQGSSLRLMPDAFKDWPKVKAILEASYDGKSLDGLLQKIKAQLIKVLDLSAMVIRVQTQIDETEDQLKNFVTEYASQFGDALNASDILRDLNAAAQGDMEAIKRLGLYEAPVEAAVPADVLQPEAPVMVEKPKSKAVWIAAAATGLFLLTRK